MNFKVGATLRLLLKTTPFLVFRFLVYVGIVVGWIVVMAIGAGLGAIAGAIGGSAGGGAAIGAFLGFVVTMGVLLFLRRYLLYLVQGAHIAVLVEAIDGRDLPAGRGQVTYGQQAVKERFAEMSVMFGVDAVIKGVLRAFNRVVVRVANLLPIPGVRQVAGIANAIVNRSLTYVDEVILGHNLRVRSTNPWHTSQQGLILYAQNYKQFLKNAVWLTIAVWLLSLLIFVVMLAPVALIFQITPLDGGLITLLIAIALAWAVKQTVVEPFAVTAMLQVWARVTDGQAPNPEWEAKLQGASGKFAEMGAKARDWATAHGSPSPAEASAAQDPPPPAAREADQVPPPPPTGQVPPPPPTGQVPPPSTSQVPPPAAG